MPLPNILLPSPLGEGLGVRLFITLLLLFLIIFTNFAIAFRPLRRSVCGRCVLDN